ncbi:MAG: DEAD/DEAH box helicase family protein [Candidatus Aphodomonas sp.]|nr:DEAD/DEAH box helicase family protein [Candidatus Aphodomonas sp.]
MAGIRLFDYQLDAIRRMKNGCILCGGVGSGKSLTALSYYYLQNGGELESISGGEYIPMDDPPADLYIITTARKRDTFEWEKELAPFLLTTSGETNLYCNRVTIDSWNNIAKYAEAKDAFFIFDEQRVVGSGVWVKSFLKIACANRWILLSATPGDSWSEYIPVFVANGFYKNRTQFIREHVIYSHAAKFPKIERYLGEGKLEALRGAILVDMDFHRPTVQHHEDIFVPYDAGLYREILRRRWDVWKDEPIENAGGL